MPLEQVNPNGSVWYLQPDQLGSTRALTDTTGALIATYTYDPYGNLTSTSGTATTPFLYAGQYRDLESNLYYLRARYYDPTTGQFVARDPLTGKTHQRYAYATDSPLNNADPSGLACTGASSLLELVQPVGHLWCHAEAMCDTGLDPTGGYACVAAAAKAKLGWTGEPDQEDLAIYLLGNRDSWQCVAGMISHSPGDYLAGKAPWQVSPGTRVLEGFYVNDQGRIEPWKAYYDDYGRLIARTDYNAGNVAHGIPETHYHRYHWTQGGPSEVESHMPGEFEP